MDICGEQALSATSRVLENNARSTCETSRGLQVQELGMIPNAMHPFAWSWSDELVRELMGTRAKTFRRSLARHGICRIPLSRARGLEALLMAGAVPGGYFGAALSQNLNIDFKIIVSRSTKS